MNGWSIEDLARYDFHGKSEQDVREEWITPLLRHLGYGPATLNQIKREETVQLQVPMRMLGSTRYQLDYRPTVLGHGLWIIEAKAPEGIDSEKHLAQAWTYATHPEVNVPLFVLADGTRMAVYDSSSPEWNVPIVDVPAHELVRRFPELVNVLAPRKVASAARGRLIHHLEKVLEAELDFSAIDETREQVRLATERARPAIAANRELVINKAEAERRAQEQRVLASARL